MHEGPYNTCLLVHVVNAIVVQDDDAGERALDEGGERQRTDVVTAHLGVARGTRKTLRYVGQRTLRYVHVRQNSRVKLLTVTATDRLTSYYCTSDSQNCTLTFCAHSSSVFLLSTSIGSIINYIKH